MKQNQNEIEVGLDTSLLAEVMEKLENMDDQELAVKFLKEFNDKTAEHGKLILNQDEKLSNDEWQELCLKSKKKVDELVRKILES
ncbi:MAG: hypothetical protein ACPGJV_14955 [Bacteriovoracaceae bacterium]